MRRSLSITIYFKWPFIFYKVNAWYRDRFELMYHFKINVHPDHNFRNMDITRLKYFVKTVDKSFKLLIYWFKMEMSLFVALDDGTSQMISTTQRISQISRTLSINKQGTSFIFFVKNIPEVKNTMLSKPYLFLNVISRANKYDEV